MYNVIKKKNRKGNDQYILHTNITLISIICHTIAISSLYSVPKELLRLHSSVFCNVLKTNWRNKMSVVSPENERKAVRVLLYALLI